MESGARRVLVLTLVRGGVTVVRYHTEIGLTDHAARRVNATTGCSLNIVGFFSKILKYIPDSGLSRFFLGVYTGIHARTTN